MKVQVKVYIDEEGFVCYNPYEHIYYGFPHNKIDEEEAKAVCNKEAGYIGYSLKEMELIFPNGLENHYVTTLEVEV